MTKSATKIEGTEEAWDNGTLGQDEKYVEVSSNVDLNEHIEQALELQPISIRLQKSLVEDLKRLAKLRGLGYQPLIRQVLTRFIECEKKQLLREASENVDKSEHLKDAI